MAGTFHLCINRNIFLFSYKGWVCFFKTLVATNGIVKNMVGKLPTLSKNGIIRVSMDFFSWCISLVISISSLLIYSVLTVTRQFVLSFIQAVSNNKNIWFAINYGVMFINFITFHCRHLHICSSFVGVEGFGGGEGGKLIVREILKVSLNISQWNQPVVPSRI